MSFDSAYIAEVLDSARETVMYFMPVIDFMLGLLVATFIACALAVIVAIVVASIKTGKNVLKELFKLMRKNKELEDKSSNDSDPEDTHRDNQE